MLRQSERLRPHFYLLDAEIGIIIVVYMFFQGTESDQMPAMPSGAPS